MLTINNESQFREGGRSDGVRLQKEFRTNCPGTNYSALHEILAAYAGALTAAGGNPATQTINQAITYLETMSQLDGIVSEW